MSVRNICVEKDFFNCRKTRCTWTLFSSTFLRPSIGLLGTTARTNRLCLRYWLR